MNILPNSLRIAHDSDSAYGRNALQMRLQRARKIWTKGLFRQWMLLFSAAGLLLLAGYALVDYLQPIPANTRVFLGLLILVLLVGSWVFVSRRLKRITLADAARRADQLLGDRRNSLLSAYELQTGKRVNSGDPNDELSSRTIADAQLGLLRLAKKDCRPVQQVKRAKYALAAVAVPLLLVILFNGPAAFTLLGRILLPTLDIPPYSPLAFQLVPENPEAFYGEDVDLGVLVSGDEVAEQVFLVTRNPDGSLSETACFHGADGHFSQSIENVIEPVDFHFRTGNARSHWHTLGVRLEPRFAVAKVQIAPPAYSGKQRREFVLGNEKFKALEGSQASLRLSSNRPLSRGRAEFYRSGESRLSRTFEATSAGRHALQFDWQMNEPGELIITIWDVQGTECPEPLSVKQEIVPDGQPEVTLESPPLYSLATPATILPVTATARDDIRLQKVNFVRTLSGFKDRLLNLGPQAPSKELEFESEIEMARLGVEIGEVLEFFVEARDENPSMTGIGTSHLARVEIISEEEYAEMLRRQIGLGEFTERYRIIDEQWSKLRKALEDLDKAIESGEPEQVDKAMTTARQAAAAAKQLFEQLADDFPAFESEQELQEVLGELADTIAEISGLLEQATQDEENATDLIKQALAKLGAHQQDVDEQLKLAEQMRQAGAIMQMASKYNQLIDEQARIDRMLQLAEDNPAEQAETLATYRTQQLELREQVVKFSQELRAQAGQLPDDAAFEQLRQDAEKFAEALEQSGAANFMERAGQAMHNADGLAAGRNSQLALEALRSLLNDSGNCMAGMCQGGLRFTIPNPDLNKTMQQMLQAILGRGQGGAGGSGIGMAGSGTGGGSMPGYSMLDLPVFGPQRTRLGGNSRGGKGGTGAGQGTVVVGETGDQAYSPDDSGAESSSSTMADKAPEKYREAVVEYFSIHDKQEKEQE